MSQEPFVPIRFKGEDKTEHLRVISIQDVNDTSLLFLANNFREAELLVCGLKLLLERETTRIGVRGGLSCTDCIYVNPSTIPDASSAPKRRTQFVASDMCGDESTVGESINRIDELPWGDVPGRHYMRGQAATSFMPQNGKKLEIGIPTYGHGQQMVRDIARNVRLPLPLPLCRVLLLDSTSPVIRKWEKDRGDSNFERSRWTFPPATPRELERRTSEHQLIASGSMCGANRTCSFDRPRYGSIARLAETHAVDADDSTKLVFSLMERNPRRGFSVKVKVTLRANKENACDATVVVEIRPVGKDMSNQAAVHKAFMLVLDEIRQRYGTKGAGLLAGFLAVVDDMASGSSGQKHDESTHRPFHRTDPTNEEKKVDTASANTNTHRFRNQDVRSTSGLVSFEDMLKKAASENPESCVSSDRPLTPSFTQPAPKTAQAKKLSGRQRLEKPNDPLMSNTQTEQGGPEAPRLIEVKPLPKIRLSLMPSPREEDEDECSSSSPIPLTRATGEKKKKKSTSSTRSSPKTNSSIRSSSPKASPLKASGMGSRLYF